MTHESPLTPDKKCKVAIVGAGDMAREHLKAFSSDFRVSVTGIHSRTKSKAQTLADQFAVPAVFDSIDALFEDSEPDLVVVAVSAMASKSVGEECFRFPWTVLLEKPPGLNAAETEDMYDSATKNRCRALVGLNRRFLSSTQTVRVDLQSLEGPRHIRVQDQEDLVNAKTIGHPSDVINNWMYANSIHLIDYFNLFGRGNITQVSPVISWNPNKPRLVAATIEFDSGDTGLYEAIWNAPGPWSVSVTTFAKRWELRPLEIASFQLAGDRQTLAVPTHKRDAEFKPGFKLQALSAVSAALGEASESPTLADGLKTMRLIQSIYKTS